jgi:diguanylate cyclase (GGDEF)-like protein
LYLLLEFRLVMEQQVRVLLVLEPHRVHRVQTALEEAGIHAETADPSLADTPLCDVVVADRLELTTLPRNVHALLARGWVGLIRIGQLPGGDVVLPEDFCTRELILACRLLAQVVRLRRAQQRARGAQTRLRKLALIDPLTGLLNRRGWQRELLRCQRQHPDRPVLLAILDIDHFKQINAQLGLSGGDQVLQAVAQAMRRTLRRPDTLARLGGDEFGLCVEDILTENATRLVERVRLAASGAASEATHSPVTLSAGYSLGPVGQHDRLFQLADKALQQAKTSGRNRSCSSPLLHDEG